MMEIETVSWDSLKPNVSNPRNGDVDVIRESIVKNGVYRPVITARDGTILAGHHLWYALGELKKKNVDIVRLDIDPDSDQARRILIVDNRSADLGNYDNALLIDLLKHLDTEDSLVGTGYDHDDLRKLIDRFETDWDTRDYVQDVAPVSAEFGKAWRLGRHILLCADSSDERVWEQAPQFAACITDPPYGISYEGSEGSKRDQLEGDTTGEEVAALLHTVFPLLPLKPGAVCYTFVGTGVDGIIVSNALREIGIARWMLVWVKNGNNLSRMDYHALHEPIWYGWTKGTHVPVNNRTSHSVMNFPKDHGLFKHPAQKPVVLIDHLVGNHDFPMDSWIVDPFAGSGTIMEVCEKRNYSAWMVEKDPSHCELILERYREMSGKEPEEL